MPTNGIKYSLTLQDQALRKGNFWVSTGDVDKGPTPISGYYISITPPTGGYSVYLNKPSDGPSIYTPPNDNDLIVLAQGLAGQTFATGASALNWFASQTDKMVCNIDYPQITTNGLVYTIDAGFTPSFPRIGNTWYDLGMTASNGVLTNGPTYGTTGGGVIVFDGTDDYVNIPSLPATQSLSLECFFNANSTASKVLIYGPTMRPRISLRSNVVNVYYSTPQGSGDIIFTFSSISTGSFNQLVYTYDPVNSHQCYLNTVAGTRTSNGTAINAYPTYGALQLGVNPGGSDGAFSGLISVFRAYNRVLSSPEILQNYQAIGKRYITFTLEYLVVAGGGGGGLGGYPSGGGGAGGLLTSTTTSLSTNTPYYITVGAGGAPGGKGSNSRINTIITTGGGNGGNGRSNGGGTGGNGGGGASNYPPDVPGGITPAGLGITGQGFAGGVGKSVYSDGRLGGTAGGGGGGGGAGSTGGSGSSVTLVAGAGGVGLFLTQFSPAGGVPSGWFAGGGGGSNDFADSSASKRGPGGTGGGGTGGNNINANNGTTRGQDGAINTGGGGGAGGYGFFGGTGSGQGGSGIVVLKVPNVYKASFSSGVGYTTITSVSGYTLYSVTSTSTTSETVIFT